MPVNSLMFGLVNCRLKSGRWLKMTHGQRRVSPSRRASALSRRTNISRRAASWRRCSSHIPSSKSASGGSMELSRAMVFCGPRPISRVNHCSGCAGLAVSLSSTRSKGAELSRSRINEASHSAERFVIISQKERPASASAVFSSQMQSDSLTERIWPAPSSIAAPPSSQDRGRKESEDLIDAEASLAGAILL